MSLVRETTRCPFCLEPIASGATRCKHCQADLSAAGKKKSSRFASHLTFRTGFITGAVFTALISVLLYSHFLWTD